MRRQLFPLVGLILLSLFLLPACQKRMSKTDAASPVPYDIKVGVALFSQPTTTSQLIVGHIPEAQGRVPADVFPQLDNMLRERLTPTKHLYTWVPGNPELRGGVYHDSETPQALPRWVALGKDFKVDLLLVPQILNWHQRQGSGAGVTSSAHVRAEFFLIDVRNGRVLRRSIFEEKQVGLVDNMLGVGDFLKRGARWITAEELTGEAITRAITELGL